MAKPLLLVASFGTTRDGTCAKNIAAVEQRLAERFPGWDVGRAYTSGMIRRALGKRGVIVDDATSALARAREAGVKRVAVLPTHLLYGEEYEKLARQVAECESFFDSVAVGAPLLATTDDMLEVVGIISAAFPKEPGRCYVLMGHGTTHYVNPVYAALEYMFADAGRNDVFVGTVEAYPEIPQVERRVARGGFTAATLAPLMLVAGDHAENDMAGDGEDSWKSILIRMGLGVETVMRGLGEYPEIRDMYVKHAEQATGEKAFAG